jgi:hypothetical protein
VSSARSVRLEFASGGDPERGERVTPCNHIAQASIKARSLSWATSLAPDANCGTSPVVADHENPHDISNDAKQEMIREALQVHAAEITVPNRERFRPLSGLLHVMSQFGVKFISELSCRNPLVICHDSSISV